MNLRSLFQDFNPSKFLVYNCLLVFTLLFALRLDSTIVCSYWLIFIPIWLWKMTAIIGAIIGSYIWWRYPQYRTEGEGQVHYKAMLICIGLHLLLLTFEILVCDKLQTGRHLWIVVFVPLIFISIISIAVCIWAVRHDRSFELELFCSVNILQFIFLALRLDHFITWSWVVVLVPLWIVMCLALIGVLYAVIFAAILLRTPDVSREQRRSSLHSALIYSLLVLPMLVSQVLLANKLDGDASMGYLTIVSPLIIMFFALICTTFGSKGGNYWWFGLRQDFCQFLLGVCPVLQEYGNISYTLHRNENSDPEEDPPPHLFSPFHPYPPPVIRSSLATYNISHNVNPNSGMSPISFSKPYKFMSDKAKKKAQFSSSLYQESRSIPPKLNIDAPD